MNKTIFFTGLIAILFSGCNSIQTNTEKKSLTAKEFAEKMRELHNVTIIDVRTPGEFSQGHLQNAYNYDWNGNGFDSQLATLDKTRPVFVYCLSGRRSAAAAGKMRSAGFMEVYELEGGIVKWRAAGLPETTD